MLLFNNPTDVITQKTTRKARKRRESERRAQTKSGINQSAHTRTTSGLAWPLDNMAQDVTVSHGTHIKPRADTSRTLGVHHMLKRNPSPENAVMIKSCKLAIFSTTESR
jgi:hypothetical protein